MREMRTNFSVGELPAKHLTHLHDLDPGPSLVLSSISFVLIKIFAGRKIAKPEFRTELQFYFNSMFKLKFVHPILIISQSAQHNIQR